MSLLDISWDLLFYKMWFCFSDICQSSGSLSDKILFWIHKSQYNRHLLTFVRKLLFLKYCMSKLFEKSLWKARIFRKVAGCKNSCKVSLHFNKMSNSLKQVLQIYSKTCIFCVLQKIFLQKLSVKIVLRVPGKSCDEIWWRCDEIHNVVNLGQKYEGDLQY